MKKTFTIGELLIDFTPLTEGSSLANIGSFQKNAGGAPANVAAAVSILGGQSALLSQVGADGFGTFLIETLRNAGVETQYISQSTEGQTSLAFVALSEDGQRDFSFYRNNAADLLYCSDQLPLDDIQQGDVIHFCSVNLVESPMKEAHKTLLAAALEKDCLISFDPNVRLPLWQDAQACLDAILEFIPLAHIMKISDEELGFITGIKDKELAIQSLFIGNVQVVLYTLGANGAELYTKTKHDVVERFAVQTLDTTGAGDAFIGAFLYQLMLYEVSAHSLQVFCENNSDILLQFANTFAARSTQFPGAIASYHTLQEE